MNAHEYTLADLPRLAARAQLGDRTALEALLRVLQHPLLAHVTGIVGDSDVADDVLQDTLLLICRHLGKLTETSWVRAWSYRIATREAVRVARRMKNRAQSLLDESTSQSTSQSTLHSTLDGDATADEPFSAELIAQLPHRIATLPPGAQIALRMHYIDEMSQAEIAEALEIPIGTVKSRIAYGLGCLRRDWAATRERTGTSGDAVVL